MRKFLTERGSGILSFLGSEGRCIYLEAKTGSTGQFPLPNDRQEVFGNRGDRSLFPWSYSILISEMKYLEPFLVLGQNLGKSQKIEIIPEALFSRENL